MQRTDADQLVEIKDLLVQYPGACRGFIHLVDSEKTETVIALPETLKLNASASLKREVDRLLGYRVFETRCQKAKTMGRQNSFGSNHKWKR